MNSLKNELLFSVFCFLFTTTIVQAQEATNTFLADPTILEHENTYYLYGTLGDPEIDGEGFVVYTSKDLKNWEGPLGATDGFALKKGDAFGTWGFWAPQVLESNGEFHMFYTADEHIAIASSQSPLGPFVNESKEAFKADVRQIDPFIFFDDDGSAYLYHVRLTEGNRIFVAELQDDLTGIKPETVTESIAAEEGWEDTQSVEWPVAEGPTVFKRGKTYYMIYSTNDYRNPDYAVGVATADHPMGPWIKSDENPILHGDMIGANGAGHGDLLIQATGEFHYVFHTHFSKEEVHPRKTAIIKLEITDNPNKIDEIKVVPNSVKYIKK